MIEVEFREVRNYINKLLRYEPFILDVREASEIQNALNIAVVISYARTFTRHDGYGNITDVNEELLKEFDEAEMELHRKIIRDRHKEFAHSDAEANDVQIYSEGFSFSMRTVRELLDKTELEGIKKMVVKISEEIQRQISKIKPTKNGITDIYKTK